MICDNAYAIKLAEEGTTMHFISEVLGHHSSEFTRMRYARFSPGSASRTVLRVLQGRKAEAGLAQKLARSRKLGKIARVGMPVVLR